MRTAYQVKPGAGAQINWGHPLARGLAGCWLFNEGGGLKAYDITGRSLGTLTGIDPATGWGTGPKGKALNFDGTNDYVALPSSSNLLLSQTVALRCYVSTLKSWNVLVSAGGGTNFWIGIDVSGNLRIGWRNAAGTGKASTIGLGATTNTWMHLAFRISVDGSNLDMAIYRDGIFANSVTAVDGFFADRYTRIGNASVYYFQGAMSEVAYYDRALSPNEIFNLSSNPYAFIARPRPFVLGASVSGVDLDGSASGSTTVSGALTVGKNLSGQADGSSSASGALSVGKPLSGSSAGTSTATGALSVTKNLAGSAAGTSTVTGSLSIGGELGGSASGASTVTGSLTVTKSLGGSSEGTCTVTGAVSVAKPLTATASGFSTVSGSLTVGVIQMPSWLKLPLSTSIRRNELSSSIRANQLSTAGGER